MKSLLLTLVATFAFQAANADFVPGRVRPTAYAPMDVIQASGSLSQMLNKNHELYFHTMDGSHETVKLTLESSQMDQEREVITLVPTGEVEYDACGSRISYYTPLSLTFNGFTNEILEVALINHRTRLCDDKLANALELELAEYRYNLAIPEHEYAKMQIGSAKLTGILQPLYVTMGL